MGAARGTFELFPTRYHRGPPTSDAATELAQEAEARRLWCRRYSGLAICTPQSPDKPIGSQLGFGVRVVPAIAARAVALFFGAHVIVGQMMAPEARSEHVLAPECADALGIRALKRVKLISAPLGAAQGWRISIPPRA